MNSTYCRLSVINIETRGRVGYPGGPAGYHIYILLARKTHTKQKGLK